MNGGATEREMKRKCNQREVKEKVYYVPHALAFRKHTQSSPGSTKRNVFSTAICLASFDSIKPAEKVFAYPQHNFSLLNVYTRTCRLCKL